MKHRRFTKPLALLALVLVAGALASLPGCGRPDPWTRPIVGTIGCPDCGGSVVSLSATGAEQKEHACLVCKEHYDPRIYKGLDWVTVCETCDKVVGTCPGCQKKAEEARAGTS